MYLGEIVETAPVSALFEGPKHPYTMALLSAVPLPDPRLKRRRILLAGDVPSPLHPPTGCRFHPRCPERMAICPREVPATREVSAGHRVACHLHAAGPVWEPSLPGAEKRAADAA
jgi:oligopeptide/dipeptide ABC transporter ATP-binding protein